MPAITVRAPAKLNLYLHILDKRADGYHSIESLVVFTQLADALVLTPKAHGLTLTVDGEFARDAGGDDTNLVLKAARALQAQAGISYGAIIQLTKNIPVGAGLGGGSADAAAMLRGFCRLWNIQLDQRSVRALATTLGADVAMCLDSVPVITRGIGEQLAPVLKPLPPLYALLVHPRRPLLTKDVYGAFTLGEAAPAWNEDAEFMTALKGMRNHLQRAAIAVDGHVAEVLLALETLQPAPELVRMTGSGACCFALYRDEAQGQRAAQQLAQHYPNWWVKLSAIARA